MKAAIDSRCNRRSHRRGLRAQAGQSRAPPRRRLIQVRPGSAIAADSPKLKQI